MTLPRDAMLKELELLPMWHRREMAATVPPEVEVAATAAPVEVTALVAADPEVAADKEVMNEMTTNEVSADEMISDERAITGAEAAVASEKPEMDVPLGESRRSAIMQLDWPALRECVAHCQSCGLAQTRTQTVFGVGDEQADWLLVGEAPGAEEDQRGEPFVGTAGKLLDNMLLAIGLKRGEKVYIANVLKCRPPQNRDPHGEEVVKCDPFLKRQVELIAPKLIVAMGRFAAQSVLNTDASIGSLRGKLHDYHGVPVIVTYHPAYLLRNLPDKAKAWEDLCFARTTMRQLNNAASSPSSR